MSIYCLCLYCEKDTDSKYQDKYQVLDYLYERFWIIALAYKWNFEIWNLGINSLEISNIFSIVVQTLWK